MIWARKKTIVIPQKGRAQTLASGQRVEGPSQLANQGMLSPWIPLIA
jgi:hypothetical protein